ncbi:MAG: hypothetical protein JWQ73_2376 [Variovorax sp.]|jgi:hypothetical protein|nr:hypothetical protein [Variovorax sp.]
MGAFAKRQGCMAPVSRTMSYRPLLHVFALTAK